MCRCISDCFGKPRKARHVRSNRTRPSREGSRLLANGSRSMSRQSSQNIPSQASDKSINSDRSSSSTLGRRSQRIVSVDDMIDQRISELRLPGLEGRTSKPKKTVSKNWKIVQEHTIETNVVNTIKSEQEKRPSKKESSEEKLRQTREMRKMLKDRKVSNTSLHSRLTTTDRNSVALDGSDALQEDSVLEDLCETTGVESRNNVSKLRYDYYFHCHYTEITLYTSAQKTSSTFSVM